MAIRKNAPPVLKRRIVEHLPFGQHHLLPPRFPGVKLDDGCAPAGLDKIRDWLR